MQGATKGSKDRQGGAKERENEFSFIIIYYLT